jgi:hypothetical protein
VALEGQVLDVGLASFADAKPVEPEEYSQSDMRVVDRSAVNRSG